MAKFYALINRANQPLPSQDLVGRMYRLLDEATKLIDDPKIQARLDDLTLLKMVLDKVKTDDLMPPWMRFAANSIKRYRLALHR